MTNKYSNLFGWLNGPADKPEEDGWVEPDLPDFIPEGIQREIKKTMFMDNKRDALRYGGHQGQLRDATGIGDAAMLQNHRQTALEQQMRYDAERQRMQQQMAPDMWSQKMLEQYRQSGLRQYTTPGVVWETTTMNGDLIPNGIMRVKFPFGEIEMEVGNDSDVDRAFDMVKHMLKVHEENTAKNAIKKNLHESKVPKAPIAHKVSSSPIAYGGILNNKY